MARAPLTDLQHIDPERVLFDIEGIRARNAHRHEMELLDRIVHFDPEQGLIAGIKDVEENAFWARGHFPHKPVLPGVLIIESAGQLCSFYFTEVLQSDRVMAFAAADEVRFRGQVVPGDQLLLVAQVIKLMRNRGAKFDTQAFVGGQLVFEAKILGMFL